MTFTFRTKRGADITEKNKAYAEKRLSKLERYFKQDSEAHILYEEMKDCKRAEITIKHGSMLFRAVTTAPDFGGTVDKAVDILVRQIHKNKTRLEKRLRQGAFDAPAELEDELVAEDELDIIRKKHFQLKPMTPEDAILQMNMLGHLFYVFSDSSNDETISVVYRRNDGGYGLIETE